MPAEFDVFLSHNSRDKPVVEEIAAWLRARGVTVWLDRDELRPGLPWQEGLEEGIRASRSVAVFIGRHNLGDWQRPEMQVFLSRAQKEGIPVIPVLLPDCPESLELPPFLDIRTRVDLRGGITDDELARLVWGIRGEKPEELSQASPASPARRHFSTPFVHNLPYPSLGALFQGREGWLRRLRESLADNPAAQATAIAGKAVHGLGGVGKTRLAVEYAWRYAPEYRAAFFLGAESPSALQSNLAALCGPALLNLPEQAATEEAVRVGAVLRWLRENASWLLILDNVDSEEAAEAVNGTLAQLQGGHVLLTGRISHWSAEVEAFPLDLLEKEDAVAFLLARTEGRRRAAEDDEAQAAEIARELGYLPLALEQAGAYIKTRQLSFAGYREEWQTQRGRVLEWFDPRLSHYPASVAATWQTSVDRLSEPARRLLECLAWLGPEPVPESLLKVPAGDTPEGGEEPRPLDLLLELESFSLVARSTGAPVFTVHRLVQDVTRRSLMGNHAKEALTEALGWVKRGFAGDPGDVRTWPQLEPLAPHVRAVVDFADHATIPEPTGLLMNNLGQLYSEKGLWAEAEPLLRRALAIDEATVGPDDPVVAICISNLAAVLLFRDRLSEAEPLMRRALAIDEASFGPEHPNVAIRLNNMAQLLKATDRLTEAESLLRRALAINSASFGPEHPEVAIQLNNLAQLLQDTNRLSEAEPLMRRALAIDEESFGLDHPKVAIRLNNLAWLLQATDRATEAEPLMRRHLEIFLAFTRSTGHEHPRLRQAIGNYASLLQKVGQSQSEIAAKVAELGLPPPTLPGGSPEPEWD